MKLPLNDPQQAAVRYLDGPLLVLAGAGSGKTRVITAKIAHLIAGGMDAGRIAAITFTNKAAREMRERVTAQSRESGSDAAAPVICTFHALGLRILRAEAVLAGLSARFSILDPADTEGIVADVLATSDRARARAAQYRISAWKSAVIAPQAALAAAADDEDLAAARTYAGYDEALRAYQGVDFDDLIALPVAVLERDQNALARWRERFDYLLIDEYQDSNPAQYRLLRLLSGTRGAFTAVGDDDQAIYGWRGATLANLEQLPRDYPSLKVIKLEQNYRSAVRILRSANSLIANNPKLFEKTLWSKLGVGDAIRITPASNEDAEAEHIARRIASLKFERRAHFADFAVLYRGNHQARAFERALSAQGIPYDVSGGASWFERSEIKDLIAYLRLIANDDDNPAFVRAVTTPRRGVGAQTLDKLGRVAAERKVSLFAATYEDALRAAIPIRAREAMDEFGSTINRMRYRAQREPAGRLLAELLCVIGYEAYLFDTFDKPQARARWESVNDFVAWLAKKGDTDGRNLLELTHMIALVTMLEGRDDTLPDAVRLTTIHAAKGLEFRHVYLAGMEEGILPHREAIARGNIEEERRLMYVAITRAQQTLELTWCKRRKCGGEHYESVRSRFIGELAQEDLRHAELPLAPEDAAREKEAGNERLKSLRAMLSR